MTFPSISQLLLFIAKNVFPGWIDVALYPCSRLRVVSQKLSTRLNKKKRKKNKKKNIFHNLLTVWSQNIMNNDNNVKVTEITSFYYAYIYLLPWRPRRREQTKKYEEKHSNIISTLVQCVRMEHGGLFV